ncbi:hypothetical protein GWI33_022162 [Rhynchophorus ferrugineus]|uniref:Methionine aminopeptidase n=2 Tax=Rhynchophorus ferrugineus TaxID=354439 RepID=A0A834IQ70_RHYFE|nr:hypothetical protein GWI33_022162 [Rhynchophorus ferrugineus]
MGMNQIIRNFFSFKKSQPNFGRYAIVNPGKVSPQKCVPENIVKPIYYKTGEPVDSINFPEIKTNSQIEHMRRSCNIAAKILEKVGKTIKVGQTTDQIDCLVHDLSIKYNSYPSPLNYKYFPKSVCTSVNNVVCHGIPDDRPLENGDVINVDITVYHNGYHGDCSKTFLVGEVDDVGKRLVECTEICLDEGISICRPGTPFCDIGYVIEKKAAEMGYNVIPAFLGHGIGEYFHGPPDIYHVRNNYPGKMQAGMTFTIEPILTQGEELIDILDDDWTAVTADNARTAQFEHTVLITDNGVEVLTKLD